MEEIFDNIIDAEENLEDVFDGITNHTLQDYYALFISEMAFCNYITLKPSMAAKLYVNILNTSVIDPQGYLDKIYKFLFDKTLDAIEKESLDEK